MSDEISTSAPAAEGSTSSEASNQSAGEALPAVTPATSPTASAKPQSMQEKISKHKGGSPGTAAGSGKAAAVVKAGAASTLNTSTGVEPPPGAQQTPNPATTAAAPALGPDGKPINPFAPNFKFKFKGEEKDIPEMYRALIKDAETEKQVRELHEKALGLDDLKPQHTEVRKNYTELTRGMAVLDKYLERDPQTAQPRDLGKFLGAYGLTDQDMFDYAKQRLEYYKMPTDQRQRVDAEVASRDRVSQLEQENTTLSNERANFQAQAMDQGMQGMLQHPMVAPIAERHPGGAKGFYRDVAMFAAFHEQTSGGKNVMSPEQAVMQYIQQRGLSAAPAVATPAAAAAQSAAQGVSAPAAMSTERAPTLPSVPGQGTSPAKKMVGSMKDLKKIRDQKIAETGLNS